ncbi:MAG: type I secretion system permease/ATPase [Caulobacteraceae bacterium]
MFSKATGGSTPLNLAFLASRPAIYTAVFFSLFINLLALVSPLYMLQVYDRVLTSRNVTTLVVITLVVVLLFVVYGMLEALRTQVLVRGGIGFDNVVRGPTFSSVLNANLKQQAGSAQAFRDIDQVREFLTGAGLITFCDAPWVPVFLVVAFMLHPYFGILAIVSGLIIFALAVANDFATREPLKMATSAGIAAQNDVSATLRNAEVMRAMGMWSGLQRRWQGRRDELIAFQALASDRGGGLMAVIRFVRQVVQTLILGGGAYLAITGKISPGAMIAASILVGRALSPIEAAVGQWKNYIGARGAWDRLQAVFRANVQDAERMPLPAPKGAIHVEAAMIAPPGARRPTIANTSFILEPGEMLAVVGPSAAGKSSLVRGLVGVWPTASGVIRLDGFDLKHWDPEQLGQHIGYLPQDVELFSGSVADNIGRFGEYESEDVITAAKMAGVHEMIQALTNGYDTQIGEGGAALSGGQRQRLALARAVFRQPALIVLDEPNASLDQEGENALIHSMIQLKQAGKTIIVVTHKMNILGFVDKILVLNNGLPQMFGDREEVMSKLFSGPKPVTAPPAQAGG